MKVIRVIERADGSYSPEAGQFIVSADHEARGGRGYVDLSHDVRNAMQFATAGEAVEFWRRQSKRKPLRPDGKPNRPLTAYTVEIEEMNR